MPNQPRIDRTLTLGFVVLIVVALAGWFGTRESDRSKRDAGTRSAGALRPDNSITPWPGSDDVRVVDDTAVFRGNLSGLAFESEMTSAGRPAVLWAVQNGPGTLYRLLRRGDQWSPDSQDGWVRGKRLRYPGDQGNVDAEGITLAGNGALDGIYVATERNNATNTVSRNSVLRFAPAGNAQTLRATNEWNVTRDMPPVDANLGLESIAWIPDSVLVAQRFHDEATGRAFVPDDYPDHGTGLFFVGLENNGMIYAYALNHVSNGFTRIASMSSGHPGVMALEFDRESGHLWATCDDTCGNTAAILGIDTIAQSKTIGRFLPLRHFARPSTLPNSNNEGFAIAAEAKCVEGRKAVFWADDSDAGGHSIRRGSLPCGPIVSR